MELLNKDVRKLIEVAKDARNKREELIQKYKKQRRGNVVVDLAHGCKYLYGETIPNPTINLGAGLEVNDLELFDKFLWKK